MHLELIRGKAFFVSPEISTDRKSKLEIVGDKVVLITGGIHLERFNGQMVSVFLTDDPRFPLDVRTFYRVRNWFQRRFPRQAAAMQEKPQEEEQEEVCDGG